MTGGAGLRGAVRQTLRGLAARRSSSLALLVTAALTVAAAALGPLYARAAQESVLHDRLTAAAPDRVGLHTTFPDAVSQASSFTHAVAQAPAPGALAAYPTRIVGARMDVRVHAAGSATQPQATRLVWRDGECGHVVLVRGRCPAGPGEAMISQRTMAGHYDYTPGGTLELLDPATVTHNDAVDAPPPDTARLRVVGVYRPVDPADTFWFGVVYFNAALSYSDLKPDTVDAVLVDRGGFSGFAIAHGEVDVDYPLDPDAVRLSDVASVTSAVRAVVGAPATGATYTDPLPDELRGFAAEGGQVATGSLLVSLQLAALALLVLFAATADALEARGGDVALAKLRGLSPGATVRFLLAEPLVLLLAALPLGLALGAAATHLLSRELLVAGVPVVVPVAGYVAALGAFVGALLAAGVASRRVLTMPVLEQWRGSRRRAHRGRRSLVIDLVLAAAAVTGLVLLATGSRGSVALLAPGLLVLAVALLGVRLLPLLVRIAVPRTHASPRLGRYLAVRQVGRRPAALRLAVLLAVAVGLAVFAVGGESIAAANRTARARIEIGAPRTVAVAFAPDADPVALSHDADPAGRWAMVAARWLPDGGATVTGAVVGVDAARLPAVGYPTTRGPSTAALARDIDPRLPAPITVRATSLRITVDARDLVGPTPLVDLLVQPTGRPTQTVRAGVLAPGRHDYLAAVPCATGCTLVGVGWERPVSSFDAMDGTAVVVALAASGDGVTFTPVDLGLGAVGGWRGQSPDQTDTQVTDTVTVDAAGVQDTFTSTGGGSPGLARVSSPARLPVWAGPGAVITPPTGDDGRPLPSQLLDADAVGYPITVVGTTDALPGVPPGGVIAELSSLRERLPSFAAEATWSVWLGPDAPPDALARLATAGLQPSAVTSTAQRLTRLGRQGPALALALLLACAIAAAVLAIGATATAIAATGRRRAFELAALRILGVSHPALTRATILEQVALLGTGVALGVPSGVLAAVVAMPVIPQFPDLSPLPLSNTPAAGPVVVIGAVFVVVLVATAVLAGVALVRAAVPSRLREASA